LDLIGDHDEGSSSMSMISTMLGRCSRGRRAQLVELAREGAKLYDRHGAGSTRLLEPVHAGPDSDVYALTTEFDGDLSYGAFADEVYRDPDFERFEVRSSADDSPWTVVSRMLQTELMLKRDGPTDRGVIVTAYVRRVVPGRFEDALGLLARMFSFLEDHGGSNCRLFQLDSAGPRTGEVLATWECGSMRARSVVHDAFLTTPEGQAIGAHMAAAESPATIIWGGVYRQLQL
jgi:hypothetical protein